MIKRIRGSLTAKIFLVTLALLLAVSAVTYLCISRFLPAVYTDELTDSLYRASESLREELEVCDTLEDALALLPDFETEQRAELFLWDSYGNQVYPEVSAAEAGVASESAEVSVEAGGIERSEGDAVSAEAGEILGDGMISADAAEAWQDTAADAREAAVDDQGSSGDVLTLDVMIGKTGYSLEVNGTMDAVSQVMNILIGILPVLIAVILGLSLVCALLSAWYLARPIRRISGISRRMAGLDFSSRCEEKREDEIGILSDSLNELSGNLSRALSELKEANRQLKSDMEKERELEKRRMDFFAAVSHELKTPVTILKGHLSGMRNRVGAYRDRDHYLNRSLETVDTMESLVQEILTAARIESGRAQRKKERMDLSELIRHQLAVRMELLEEKALAYELDIPEHLWIQGDPGRMEKVLGNLFSNAYRYTPRGNRICITLKKEQEMCRFSIENTGTRIPEEAFFRLFEPFYRVESSRSKETGGSGLGLYLARSLLEQAGGKIWAENTEEGVKFTFVLSSTENT